ncbi:hypothetical protein LY78DRAFT_664479 [Colletotrichum sublineola]|uniref:Transmembrane protein n=1 Tax=Colletotrichum sublineola TaxID=1173701 RepID=A0A066XWW5_COLSU|nr:hypothetical protein LY78DRAFT_664479 [Colletotrichum sublineola]KDN70256.1 hypothetical protein CSUB01_12067 [Colletotrichum sublineola]
MNKTEFNQSRYTPDVAATTRPTVTPADAQRQTFFVTPRRPSTSPIVRRVSRYNPDGCRTPRSIASSNNDHNDCRPLFENVARKLFSEPEPRLTTSPPAVQHMSNLRRAVLAILFLALALIFPKFSGLFVDIVVAVDYHWVEL